MSHSCTTTSSSTTSATRASPVSSSSTDWSTAARASASGSTDVQVVATLPQCGDRASRALPAIRPWRQARGAAQATERARAAVRTPSVHLLVGERERHPHVVGAGGAVEVAGRDHEAGGRRGRRRWPSRRACRRRRAARGRRWTTHRRAPGPAPRAPGGPRPAAGRSAPAARRTCTSSPSAAAVAACTGAGIIRPPCLRTSPR